MTAGRSPSSPSRSLSACFNAGLKLYDAFPNASFTQTQVASVLDLSATSSSLKGWLSDLKQYGIIEKSGSNEYIVSSIIKEYGISGENDQDMIRYELATRPKLFSQIIENQGNHLPDNALLASVLTARFGFNKTRALKVSKALRESLEWANAIDVKGNIIAPSQKPGFSDNPDTTDLELVLDESQEHVGLSASALQPQFSGSLSSDNSGFCSDKPLVTEIPLANYRKIRIEYPADTTLQEADRASVVLKALCIGE